MNKTLWTFGDSYTAGFIKQQWADSYIKWKGYTPKVYGDIVSEELGIQLINRGVSGSDNYTIFENICNASPHIKKNDIIIVGWTSLQRFRLALDSGTWIKLLPNAKRDVSSLQNISNKTIDEIFVNRMNDLYLSEVVSWIKFIDSAFSSNIVIHWSPFGLNLSKHFLKIHYMDIKTETNGEVDDGHYSEIGHVNLAKDLLKFIQTPNSKKIM